MQPTTYEVIYQSIIAFFVFFVLARILGKRQIAQLTFFDYITGLTLGDIAAHWSLAEVGTLHAGMALLLWVILSIVLAYIQKKSFKGRKVLGGNPVSLIENGQIMEKRLSNVQMTVNELLMLLRQKDVFNVSDVEYAVLENNGKLSVVKKPEQQLLTPMAAGVPVASKQVPQILIVDGKVIQQSLDKIGHNQEWLLGEVMKSGAQNYKDVFFAQFDSNGKVSVDLYNDSLRKPQVKVKSVLAAKLKELGADVETFALQTEDKEAKKCYAKMENELNRLIQDILPYLKE